MDNSVLKVFNKDKGCLGTGFVIDSDENGVFVVTCGHVINKCPAALLVEGFTVDMIQNHYKDDLDIAILYVRGLHKKPLKLSQEQSSKLVKVIGYSNFQGSPKREPINNIKIKLDVKISKDKLNIDAIKLYPDEPISDGYSGSPVICQTSNQVIGIVNLQVANETNYAISAKHILNVYDIKKFVDIPVGPINRKGLTTELKVEDYIVIQKLFEENLTDALEAFSTQPKVWIDPIIHTVAEDESNLSNDDTKISIKDIIDSPRSYSIQARQQFGLTCLGHHLVKEAWSNQKPSLFLVLDINELKPNTRVIEKNILKKLKKLNLRIEDVECIILDEFSSEIENASEILNKLSSFLDNIPLIVLVTVVENSLLNESLKLPNNRKFNNFYLWSLPKNSVRKVVSEYNDEKYIGDENDVLNKVIDDLEVLNIPRTPLNCLTILKISEIEFDDSPVNRTEMIRRVLFLLFNIDDIPKYKTRPDLKDTEYVLGYLCELMLRENKYSFTRENFLELLNHYCEKNEMDLDISVIFDILYKNNIIVERGREYYFKFTYWIFYFAAHRMRQNKEFASFIFKDTKYSSYPELIEFYTGLDRRRDDALSILINDIQDVKNIVKSKCALPTDFNIYDTAKWTPGNEEVEKMQNEISDGVLNSNLPITVKDQYADRSYNKARPLTQSINSILKEYSFLRLFKVLQASSKALRNSDYASPEIRHKLLTSIMEGWEQITNVVIILSPILAKQNSTNLEGVTIYLDGTFGGTESQKFNNILLSIPNSTVSQYKDDLFSKKMGPFLYKHIEDETNLLIKHLLNLFIIYKRPNGWEKHMQEYILAEEKNSFYLHDIYNALRAEYTYSITSKSTLNSLEKLIKMTAAKHKLGLDNPTKKAIRTIDKKYKDVVPKRNIE